MIPFARPFSGEEEIEAAGRAIASGWTSQGPRVKEFEDAFTAYTGAKYACAVSNCTAALHLALLAVGVKPNEAVITVSHSFIATANSIRYCQAEPIFVDIDIDTFNMSPAALEECLRRDHGRRVAAVLVVHQMGVPCDLKAILAIASEFGLPVIEDAACAAGSEISIEADGRWEKIGRPHGDIACFSFHPRKVISTGEGGMIVTNNQEHDSIMRLLRHQGMSISDTARHNSKKVIFEEYVLTGYNYRMTDIQAAIGIEQLKKAEAMIAGRRDIAAAYHEKLKGVPWLKLPDEPAYSRANRQSYPVRLLEGAPLGQKAFMQYMLDAGVSTRPGVMNIHQQKPYLSNLSLRHSELARNTTVLLPLFNGMTEEEVGKIAGLIKNA